MENGLQCIRPDLIPLNRGMKLIGIHHAVEQRSLLVRQLVINVQIPDFFAGHFGKVFVDFVYRGHHCDVVITGENAHHDDHGIGSLRPHDVYDGSDASRNIRDLSLVAAGRDGVADVVGAGEQNNNFWMNTVQFSIVETP